MTERKNVLKTEPTAIADADLDVHGGCIVFSDVLVSSYQSSGSAGGDSPVDGADFAVWRDNDR